MLVNSRDSCSHNLSHCSSVIVAFGPDLLVAGREVVKSGCASKLRRSSTTAVVLAVVRAVVLAVVLTEGVDLDATDTLGDGV